jgi:hypothetical protein
LSVGGTVGKAGVTPKALCSWLEKSLDDPESPYHRLALRFARAVADWEEEALAKGEQLATEGSASWTYHMTHLERRLQNAYGKTQKLDVSHSASGELEKRLHELNRGSSRATLD